MTTRTRVVSRTVLREIAVQASLAGEDASTFDRLHGLEEARAEQLERDLPDAGEPASLGPALLAEPLSVIRRTAVVQGGVAGTPRDHPEYLTWLTEPREMHPGTGREGAFP